MAAEGGLHGEARRHRAHKTMLYGLVLFGVVVTLTVIAFAPSIELGSAVTGAHSQPAQLLASNASPGTATRLTALRVASPMLSPGDPLRLAMAYDNGRLGAVLQATWTVDGNRFRSLRVVLADASGEHVLTSVPPGKGWPLGEHRIVLSSAGVALGEVVFRVS